MPTAFPPTKQNAAAGHYILVAAFCLFWCIHFSFFPGT
nr:MAG TPA: hypothetical protein [Caudoviricetes sp.]